MCLLTGLCKVIRLEEKTQNFLSLLGWIFCRFHPCRRVSNFPVFIRDSTFLLLEGLATFRGGVFNKYI